MGKKHTPERVRNISNALTGRTLSESHKRNIGRAMSEALVGTKKSELHKARIGATIRSQRYQQRCYEYEYKTEQEEPFFGFIDNGDDWS